MGSERKRLFATDTGRLWLLVQLRLVEYIILLIELETHATLLASLPLRLDG